MSSQWTKQWTSNKIYGKLNNEMKSKRMCRFGPRPYNSMRLISSKDEYRSVTTDSMQPQKSYTSHQQYSPQRNGEMTEFSDKNDKRKIKEKYQNSDLMRFKGYRMITNDKLRGIVIRIQNIPVAEDKPEDHSSTTNLKNYISVTKTYVSPKLRKQIISTKVSIKRIVTFIEISDSEDK